MPPIKERGRIGQNRYGGIFSEEFLPELRGRRGMATYREMADNDDVIGSIMFAIKMLIRQVEWNVEPGGSTAKDREAAEFVLGCLDDMTDTWTDTVSEILSFLTYGWSAHEIVYKRRNGQNRDPRLNSKYSDGLIGWMKLPVRAQETLYQWIYDEKNDELKGLRQMPPPDFKLIDIPIEKLLLFRTESRKNNPEGRSILRNAYRGWYFKRRIQEIEGIGIERDLAGFPVLYAPENVDIWGEEPEMVQTRAAAEAVVQNIRRDALEGLVMPNGWELKLLSTGGRRQFDTSAIIERYDTRIAMTVMADFVMLGHQKVGSFALADNKTLLFSMATCAFIDIICEVFNNKAIPQLINVNGAHFKALTGYPMLTHGDIETADLDALGTFLNKAVASGVIVPDRGLEDYAREMAGLPQRIDDFDADINSQCLSESRAAGNIEPNEQADGQGNAEMVDA